MGMNTFDNQFESTKNNRVQPERQMFYTCELSPKLSATLQMIDEQKRQLEKLKSYPIDLQHKIKEKLRSEWTYNSNAIEGSTLSLGQTIFFLKEGLTVEGKPFKYFMDAKNHAEAIDYIYEVIKSERPLSESFIKSINQLILEGVTYTKAVYGHENPTNKPATPGQYKALPNHVLQSDGNIHKYVEPIQVQSQMEELINWVAHADLEQLHPVIVASIAHYNMVRIHPFDDGNGRGARLLMNLILMKKGYLPAIIENEKRRQYIEAIQTADKGNIEDITTFVTDSLYKTQEAILEVMNTVR